MKLDTLDGLNDNELRLVIGRSEELLKTRDEDRKAKAMEDARAILAAAGLTFSDIAGKGKGAKGGKTQAYRGGTRYQHPVKKELVWTAKGQKPGWLRDLEAEGKRPVELPGEALPEPAVPPLKKTA